MKIKLSEVAAIKVAHEALDGFQRASKDAAGKETVVFERHKYPAKVTWNRVKNTRLLNAKAEDIEALRIALVKKHAGDAWDKTGVPEQKLPEFFAEFKEALKIEDDMPLLSLSEADLNLYDPKENPEGNVIAAAIIVGLGPLLS